MDGPQATSPSRWVARGAAPLPPDGCPRNLREGLEDLRGGLEDLRRGLEDLREGLEDLRGGLEDLLPGLEDFRRGLEDLRGGLEDLRQGLEDLCVSFENARKFGIKILARRARVLIPNFRCHILRLIVAQGIDTRI